MKCRTEDMLFQKGCRSREGAWIEIPVNAQVDYDNNSRSREGAWIEMVFMAIGCFWRWVAPVRERGLKYRYKALYSLLPWSLPQGSVD